MLSTMGGGEGEGETNRESSMEAYTLWYVKQPSGSCCVTRGTHAGAL